jgi:hypothetical protein
MPPPVDALLPHRLLVLGTGAVKQAETSLAEGNVGVKLVGFLRSTAMRK